MSELDPKFVVEISRFGAANFSACYNCGNCTAVCNLSESQANFPRMFIRYGITGQSEKILGSKEIWLCYACGDCSESCPRQAFPGDYMAALRRYTIAKADKTGLTRLLFTNYPLAIIFTFLLACLLGSLVLTVKSDETVARWLFTYIPYEVVHNIGLAVFLLTGLTMIAGIVNFIRKLRSLGNIESAGNKPLLSWPKVVDALKKTGIELAAMKRYQSCDKEEDSYWKHKPWLLKPWFVHWSIMWGFLGLLLATTLDFIFKDPATMMWLPSRLLGTVTGLMLMYGTSLAIAYRLMRLTKTYSDSKLTDWTFLVFLWISGLTGFWLEFAVMVNADTLLNQVVFLIHTVISMELVLLFAFSKFAHAVYRPVALYLYFYRAK
jgi:ferredoxin